jgi:hypothetical protein
MHDLLSSGEAVEFMGQHGHRRTMNTLNAWAKAGTGPVTGPVYVKIGKFRVYKKQDLLDYIASITGPRRRGTRGPVEAEQGGGTSA